MFRKTFAMESANFFFEMKEGQRVSYVKNCISLSYCEVGINVVVYYQVLVIYLKYCTPHPL